MHSITGTVTKIVQITSGYNTGAFLGTLTTIELTVPWVGLKYNSTDEYENKTHSQDVTYFLPVTATPPLIGDTVTLTLDAFTPELIVNTVTEEADVEA